MVCDKLCIELKSLKLYFWSFRDVGAFHEAVTNTILDAIVAATKPRFVRIAARWNVRGGIYTNVVVEHRKKGWSAGARRLAAGRSESGHALVMWAKVPGTAERRDGSAADPLPTMRSVAACGGDAAAPDVVFDLSHLHP